MKHHIVSFTCLACLFFELFSCYPQESIISTSIYQTLSKLTLEPSYTNYPTYTNLSTIVQEVTKVVFITKTPTLTPLFSPTITSTPSHTPIPLQGRGKLMAQINQDPVIMSFFDLDTGRNINDFSSDLRFDVGCGSMCFDSIDVINGAIYFIYGRQEPSYEECKNNMVSQSDFITDKYICILTNSNNISIIKVDWSNLARSNYWTVAFYFKTWKNRGS